MQNKRLPRPQRRKLRPRPSGSSPELRRHIDVRRVVIRGPDGERTIVDRYSAIDTIEGLWRRRMLPMPLYYTARRFQKDWFHADLIGVHAVDPTRIIKGDPFNRPEREEALDARVRVHEALKAVGHFQGMILRFVLIGDVRLKQLERAVELRASSGLEVLKAILYRLAEYYEEVDRRAADESW